MTKQTLALGDGWATPAQLRQIATDYRAAVALIDEQGWTKHISDGGLDGKPICAARALGLVVGVDDSWDNFGSRASLALSACYRVTRMLLVQINDKATEWSDVRAIMIGLADECDREASRGTVNEYIDAFKESHA